VSAERVGMVPDSEPPARAIWGIYIGAPAYFIDGKMFAHTVGPTTEHVLVYLHDDGAREITGEFVAPSLAIARYLIEEEAAACLAEECEQSNHLTITGARLVTVALLGVVFVGLLLLLIFSPMWLPLVVQP